MARRAVEQFKDIKSYCMNYAVRNGMST